MRNSYYVVSLWNEAHSVYCKDMKWLRASQYQASYLKTFLQVYSHIMHRLEDEDALNLQELICSCLYEIY